MLKDARVLAVVPARRGSKGIPNKNLKTLNGVSLIGWAGNCVAQIPWLDAAVISTDSKEYVREGHKYGLEAPFIRPDELSGDYVSSMDVVKHALKECDAYYNTRFDLVLIVEPTSPFRRAEDIVGATELLLESNSKSVICVSPANTRYHPKKMLAKHNGALRNYIEEDNEVIVRQQLDKLYVRNGVCYVLTRDCVQKDGRILNDATKGYMLDRPLVNIDEPLDLLWAEFLLDKQLACLPDTHKY